MIVIKKTLRRAIIIGNLCVLLLGAVIWSTNALSALVHSTYDLNMKQSLSDQPDEDILVIALDDQALQKYGVFPWERNIYIPFLQQLEQPGAEPKVIAFDVMFDTNSKDPENDQLFAEQLKKHNNVLLPSQLHTQDVLSRSAQKNDHYFIGSGITSPTPILEQETIPTHINGVLDSDGVIRRTWLQLQAPDGSIIPSLAYQSALMAGADVKHYLDYDQHKLINIKYDADSYNFETVSFTQVMDGSLPKNMFKDRIVLIGFTAAGYDKGTTPIEKQVSLVYVHANIINQLLNDEFISPENNRVTQMLMLLLLLITALFTWRMKSIASIMLIFGITVTMLIGQYYLFSYRGMYINAITPIAAMYISFFANIAIKTYYETKHKNFITRQFGRYISPDLVKQIARSDQELALGGISKELSILFLDIRGFTTLSEKLTPEEVVDFLNTMFNLITERTLENRGTIDKFIGDAAMIIFNAPLDLANHEYWAVKTAYDIQKGMQGVRDEIMEKHGVSVSVGIGVNTGIVVVGNIGSYIRVDYTAIGDNVNIAARIESNTVANQILVSDATYDRTKQYFEYNCIGEKMMKGKTVPIKLYEVLDVVQPLDEAAAAERR